MYLLLVSLLRCPLEGCACFLRCGDLGDCHLCVSVRVTVPVSSNPSGVKTSWTSEREGHTVPASVRPGNCTPGAKGDTGDWGMVTARTRQGPSWYAVCLILRKV